SRYIMFTSKARFGRIVFGVVLSALAVSAAHADVTVAKKAKFTGRVSVAGKAQGTYTVWQEDGTGDYVNTGNHITVGAGGGGTVRIVNAFSGTLIAGRKVKIGDNNGPNDQPAMQVAKSRDYFASVMPGFNPPNTMTVCQAVYGQGNLLLETWN